jgi:hypothetical protein
MAGNKSKLRLLRLVCIGPPKCKSTFIREEISQMLSILG